jgi:hypothetical protein
MIEALRGKAGLVLLEPALAGSVLGIGVLLSLATVPWINALL